MGRDAEAIASFEAAVGVMPNSPEANTLLGNALRDLRRFKAAFLCYERAVALDVNYAAAYNGGGLALFALRHFKEAIQQKAAERWTREEMKGKTVPLAGGAQSGARLRIGYFSSDFYQHAVAYQLAEVIELHDRSKFEVSAFSFGPDTQDTMRRRLQAAFEHFLDVREKSDEEIVHLARDRQLDIAVDLKGYTQDARPGRFAQRLAPLQVSYLGYPGTMGASFMDYIVADAAVIPVSSREFYREKVISLPGCFFLVTAPHCLARWGNATGSYNCRRSVHTIKSAVRRLQFGPLCDRSICPL